MGINPSSPTESSESVQARGGDIIPLGAILDSIPVPTYMLDNNQQVVEWSEGLEPLLGLSKSEMIGHDELFGRDENGDLIKTVSNYVVDNPTNADKHDHIDLVESEYTDELAYESTTWLLNDAGEERFIRFTAVPLYRNDEFVGAFQLCQDETERQRKQEATEALVEEVISTLKSLSRGDLKARASFDQTEIVEPHLLKVLQKTNEMAGNIQSIIGSINEQTQAVSEVSESAIKTATSAEETAEMLETQSSKIYDSVSELENFSARMQEVAATSDEATAASERARDAAQRGLKSGREAKETTEKLGDTGSELLDTVTKLEAGMSEIGEIIELIQDIADQTNILALNASIEAARAGEAGDGFSVVAEEVKSLAEETGDNAKKIASQIDEVQSQTSATVQAIDTTNEQIKKGVGQVDDTLSELSDIEELVTEASHSIEEIAEANNNQARAVEKLTATFNEIQERTDETQDIMIDICRQANKQEAAIKNLENEVERLAQSEGVN